MLIGKSFLVYGLDPKIERRQKSICFTSLTMSFRLLLAPIRNSSAVKGLAGAFYWLHSFFGSGLGSRLCWIGAGFLFLIFSGGCASFEVAREVQSGRAALRLGNPRAAISHFDAAARLDPDYITDFTLADIGIWTYLGRSYYEAEDLDRARESLKRARNRTMDDYFARLYLGLILSQNGARKEGLAVLKSGLKGLEIWLETIPGRSPDGKYWDPGGYLVRTVTQTLTILHGEEIDWITVRENIQWLGKNFDEEIDEVERDAERDGDDDDSQTSSGSVP